MLDAAPFVNLDDVDDAARPAPAGGDGTAPAVLGRPPGSSDVLPLRGLDPWDLERNPAALRVVVELARERGIPPAACLAGTHVDPRRLAEETPTVRASEELAAIRNLVVSTGDEPGLGVAAGVRFGPGALGVFGLVMLSSRSVRELLTVAERFSSLTWGVLPRRWTEADGVVASVLDEAAVPPDVRRFVVERDLAFAVSVIDKTVGGTCPLVIETTLEPERTAALQELLGPRPLMAGRPSTRIRWTRETLDLPLAGGDAMAVEVCARQCELLLERLAAQSRPPGAVAWVERALLRLPPERWRLEDVAHERHVHPRTLKRMLTAEGTSFRVVVDARREELATALLRDTDLPLAEVAARVGYGDAASFAKAYRRWTGDAPTTVRRAT